MAHHQDVGCMAFNVNGGVDQRLALRIEDEFPTCS